MKEFTAINNTIKRDSIKKGYEKFFPEPDNLYKALELTSVDKVRVVILGQDPYHQMCDCGKHPRAQGLSFSVAECDSIPMSLKNIFKEIASCYPEFVIPGNGDLTRWAEQGVLLLNTCLTVVPDKPGSHSIIWHGIIEKIISLIDENNPNCIYLLWGKEAETFGNKMIPERAIKLVTSHPSGFSVHRGFFGCKHFSKVNDLLKNNPIKW